VQIHAWFTLMNKYTDLQQWDIQVHRR
jgi:hypothetical protein